MKRADQTLEHAAGAAGQERRKARPRTGPSWVASMLALAAAATLTTASAAPAVAQQTAQMPDSAAFVTLLGADTLAVERFVWTPGRIEAETVLRSPRTRVGRYVLETDPHGELVRYEGRLWNGGTWDGEPAMTETAVRRGNGYAYTRTGMRPTEGTFSAEGAVFPFIDMIHWPFELVLRRAAAVGTGGDMEQPLFSGTRVLTFGVLPRGGNAWGLRHPTRGTMDVETDDMGRLLHLDAGRTTRALTVERVGWLELPSIAGRFAAADAAGHSFGALSGRGSEEATVHGAEISVDYGTPHKRGRVIFGGLLKWGEVWRTGANAATHFTTSRDLVMGDLVVPAGTYTLFTRPQPDGGVLMINTRTNINGQQYDPEADLGRVAMTHSTGDEVVEIFTIRVRETPEGGVLELLWDRDIFSVPFTVR